MDRNIEEMILKNALELFKLPRIVGQFEGTDMAIRAGRFGPYVFHRKKYASPPKEESPLKMILKTAIQLAG